MVFKKIKMWRVYGLHLNFLLGEVKVCSSAHVMLWCQSSINQLIIIWLGTSWLQLSLSMNICIYTTHAKPLTHKKLQRLTPTKLPYHLLTTADPTQLPTNKHSNPQPIHVRHPTTKPRAYFIPLLTRCLLSKHQTSIYTHPTHHLTIGKHTQGRYNTNNSWYHSQNAQTSHHRDMQQTYSYQTPKQPFLHFSNESFTSILSFNRLGRTPIIPLTQLNYSAMSHKLNYDSVSMHTQDYLEMQELIRESGDDDVHGT